LKFAHNPENHSRREFFEDLQQLAFPIAKKQLPFPFSFGEKFSVDGWTVFEPVAELKRMVILRNTALRLLTTELF